MHIRTLLVLAFTGCVGAGLWASSAKIINDSKGTWGLDPMAKFVAVPALGRQPWEATDPWLDLEPPVRRSVTLDLGTPPKHPLNPGEVAVISEESLEVCGAFFRLVDARGFANALLWVGSSPSGSSGESRLEVRCLPANGNAPWVHGVVRLESSEPAGSAWFTGCRVRDIAVIQADAWPDAPSFPKDPVAESKIAASILPEAPETKGIAREDSTLTWASGLAMEPAKAEAR